MPSCAAAFVTAGDQPAARKPGVLSTELFTLIRRSPIPSLMTERYEVRSCQIVKLEMCQRHSRVLDSQSSCSLYREAWGVVSAYSSFCRRDILKTPQQTRGNPKSAHPLPIQVHRYYVRVERGRVGRRQRVNLGHELHGYWAGATVACGNNSRHMNFNECE